MTIRDRIRRMSPVRRTLLWVVPVVLVGFILIFAAPIAAFLINPPSFGQTPTVATQKASMSEWRPQLQVVGTLTPSNGADLTAEVAGVVAQIYFKSGADTRAGANLVRLRDADETSRLAALQAASDLAVASDARTRKLFDIEGVSKAELEASAANLKSARAAVAQQMAVAEKKKVRAPFSGRLGIRTVNVGQYVNVGAPVVTLQALDPIFLDFTVPQQSMAMAQKGQSVSVSVDAFPGKTFTGHIAAINPKIDIETRNASVRAVLPNPDRKLLPGMYANAKIDQGRTENHITIPQAAVTFNPFGSTVYVVNEEKKDGKTSLIAKQTFVTTGETRGDQVAVLSGLKVGDVVVTAGQIKIQNGAEVKIDNSVQPTSDPNPSPVEN